MHPRLSRALLVEDDDELRTVLAHMFRRSAVDVLEARTARQASQILSDASPDLILIDVRLPDGSAFEVLSVASERPPTPAFVAMSGQASAAEAFELARVGTRVFLPKPFSLKQLKDAIEIVFSEPPVLAPVITASVGTMSIFEVQRSVRRIMVTEALAREHGNRSAAARLLGVTRQAIQHLVRVESQRTRIDGREDSGARQIKGS